MSEFEGFDANPSGMEDGAGVSPETPPPPSPGPPPVRRPGAADPLPPDIEAVWGGGKLDATGLPAIGNARVFVDAWGVEVFRRSAVHQAALAECARQARTAASRAAYLKAFKASKEKK